MTRADYKFWIKAVFIVFIGTLILFGFGYAGGNHTLTECPAPAITTVP